MQEFLNGAAAIISYLLPAVIAVFIARKPLKLPDELFRKALHLILMAAYIPILFVYRTWQLSACFARATASWKLADAICTIQGWR